MGACQARGGDQSTQESAWAGGLSHENGGPSTLYIHPVSGNALGPALYVREKQLEIKIHMCDIMAGEVPHSTALTCSRLRSHGLPTLVTSQHIHGPNPILTHDEGNTSTNPLHQGVTSRYMYICTRIERRTCIRGFCIRACQGLHSSGATRT